MTDDQPALRIHYGDGDLPVVIAVPHAGRDYPASLLAQLACSPVAIQRLEDRHADRLADVAIRRGVPTIIATAPRAWLDLNRAEDDIDYEMVAGGHRRIPPPPSVRVRGGLGLVPRRLSGVGELWRARLTLEEVEARVAALHRPYHATIAAMLAAALARWGAAVLIDLHSMPSLPVRAGRPTPRVVVGDLFGRAASDRFSSIALAAARRRGLTAALNHPYAGGYTLARHGAPLRGVYAVQIEVDRALYLDERFDGPGPGLASMAIMVGEIASDMADAIRMQDQPLAAE